MFHDPKVDYGPQLNMVIWLLVSVSSLFLFTRLYLKNCQNRGLWWDDYTLLASWIALIGQAGLASYVISLGYGKQILPMENLALFPLPINLLSSLLIVANLLGKTSFAMTMFRIPAVWMRVVCWCVVISLVGTLGTSAVFVWVECLPWQQGGNCVSLDVAVDYNTFSCAYSSAMDVALAFLPWKYIWGLQMSKKEKFGVVVAMSMGVFAGVAAAIKTSTIHLVHESADPTSSVQLVAWGNAEAAICIMAASIPILRALVRGGFGLQAAPMGYETGDPTMMAESGLGRSVDNPVQRFSQAAPSLPPIIQRHQLPSSSEELDKTLTEGAPELTGNKNLGLDGLDDWSDEDSIEMTNYHARPHTPTDFTRRGMV
ncbi:hypothetical protein B0T19DRAFT_268688 [Cercophora scortea]|uniref:Rhodopsin domain-containing protein n=1 Tax=Cercophora scortea TaxID=314031 RepID=A0AAE0M513_9PEZI|nr:hypothetical protein B0T19DRAFT_268688 [Cercophora scortea]